MNEIKYKSNSDIKLFLEPFADDLSNYVLLTFKLGGTPCPATFNDFHKKFLLEHLTNKEERIGSKDLIAVLEELSKTSTKSETKCAFSLLRLCVLSKCPKDKKKNFRPKNKKVDN